MASNPSGHAHHSPARPCRDCSHIANGSSSSNTAAMPSNAGNSTVPLPRITPTSTALPPIASTPHTTVRNCNAASSRTSVAARIRPVSQGASATTSTTTPLSIASPSSTPVRAMAGSRAVRPAPIACAARMVAVMPSDIAGSCTQLINWLTAP